MAAGLVGCSVFFIRPKHNAMNRKLYAPSLMMLCTLLFLPPAGMAQDSTLFFVETFDAVTAPTLPGGWSDATLAWETSSSVASTGSGGNNVRISGTTAGTLLSPTVDLSGMTAGSLQYLARRTSSYAQEAMRVLATLDGGQSFITVLDDGSALPFDDGSYASVDITLPATVLGQSSVQFAFEALGGITSGANIRLDDVTVFGSGTPQLLQSVVGFAEATSTADGAGQFEVPIFIDFNNTTPLQGLQLDLSWMTGAFTLTDILRGNAVSDTTQWSINAASREGEMKAVLLGSAGASLSVGTYDPLLTLVFMAEAGNTVDEATLTLERVLGALSLRTGDDAGLIPGLATHTVTFTSGNPEFTPDATTRDLGLVAVDSTAAATLLVTNTGTAPLVIDSVEVDNARYTIDMGALTIEAGESRTFTLSFTPTFLSFGSQTGRFTFYHNAAGGSDTIDVSGVGTGGRGDVSNDGAVDASDLVAGVDAVLERLVLPANEVSRIDVYPFEMPDGALDIRDLTVLSQAILLGAWPDEIPLPVAPAPEQTIAKEGTDVTILLETRQGAPTLYLQTATPLRAFQMAVKGDWSDAPTAAYAAMQEAGAQLQVMERTDDINVLGVRYDGGTIAPGKYPLLTYASNAAVDLDQPGYALAVAADGERLPVVLAVAGVDVEDTPVLPDGVTLAQPYPNPFNRVQHAALDIPFMLSHPQRVEIAVYDLLGRSVIKLLDGQLAAGTHHVKWNGKDANAEKPAAGMYLLKLKTDQAYVTRMIVMY